MSRRHPFSLQLTPAWQASQGLGCSRSVWKHKLHRSRHRDSTTRKQSSAEAEGLPLGAIRVLLPANWKQDRHVARLIWMLPRLYFQSSRASAQHAKRLPREKESKSLNFIPKFLPRFKFPSKSSVSVSVMFLNSEKSSRQRCRRQCFPFLFPTTCSMFHNRGRGVVAERSSAWERQPSL